MIDQIGKRIRLRDLQTFMAVVQAGSMGKAARRLNTSQPNISKSLGDLERTLGVQLLERHRQGVAPTECGRALLDGGAVVFDDLERMLKNIEFLADPTAGEVRVGCNPFLAASFVSKIIVAMSRRHPRMSFRLVTAYGDDLQRQLIDRKVDLLITRKTGVTDERLAYEFLFNDSYSVVVGADSNWACRRTIGLDELVNERWVLPPADSLLASVVMKAFRANRLEYPRPAVIAEPAEVRMSLLAAGPFISIFPDSVLRFHRKPELKALAIRQSLGYVPIGVVTLKNRTISATALSFVQATRQAASNQKEG